MASPSMPPHQTVSTWEFRLSSLHLVVVIGLVTGSMAAAFFMGFISGERAGFETGQESALLAQVPRIPIPHGSVSDVTDAPVSEDVYDKMAANLAIGNPPHGNLPVDGVAARASVAGAPNSIASSRVASAAASELPTLGRIEEASAVGGGGGAYGADLDSIKPALEQGSLTQRGLKTTTLGALDEPRLDPDVGQVERETVRREILRDVGAPADSEKLDSAAFVSQKRVDQGRVDTGLGSAGLVAGSAGSGSRVAPRVEPFKSPGTNSALSAVESAPRMEVASRSSAVSVARTQTSGIPQVAPQSNARQQKPDQASARAAVASPKVAAGGIVSSAALPKGWYAQVAAPRKQADAEKIAAKLRKSGFPVVVEQANVRGDEYFRVVVGPERDKTQVDRLISQVKREGFDPFARAVK